MKNFLILLLFILSLTACTRTFYIVRHAEKEISNGNTMMANDPPLTEMGKQRAEALKQILKSQKIGYIFSTNTIRTKTTGEPLRAELNLATEIYSSASDTAFINKLRSLKKNALIIGHSNTVDELVNNLCGSIKIPGDLAETEYDNLFVVKKKGQKLKFENKKYGTPSP